MNTRAIAALILNQVLLEKRSLTHVLPAFKKQCQNAKDAALLQMLCFGTVRFLPRLLFISHHLLKKAFKAKDQDILYLICLGIYQLRELNIAPHAAISETVEAARQLKKPWATGVINAVLRNYVRRSAEINTTLDHLSFDEEAHSLHPAWLLKRLQEDWPERCSDIINANNTQGPMALRVNRQRISPEDYLEKLRDTGMAAERIHGTLAGIRLATPMEALGLPGFKEGWVSIQDGSAQLASQFLTLLPGQRVLDACAAPGGKTAAILETEPKLAHVTALDIAPDRSSALAENLTRLKLQATIITGDAIEPAQWWDSQLFDRILLDAPCSATGVIRRHPDIKFLRHPNDIKNLAERQRLLLTTLWPLLKPEGILLYATCSVLHEENKNVIESFLNTTPNASLLPLQAAFGEALPIGWQILSGQNDSDGFYYASIVKAKCPREVS